jgi:molybdopterin molybdotransferase
MPVSPVTRVPVADAAGLVLRESLHAERDQPPFNRVTMDGIAVRQSALDAGRREFKVVGTQGAGAEAIPLGSDTNCVEIMTGAMLPDDADTVIPVERIRREDDEAFLEPAYKPSPGQFVHPQGSDHAGGQLLLSPGQRIGAAEIAVLTICGQATVEVSKALSAAVISTGSELIEPGQPLAAFQIRSSNELAIAAALGSRGIRQPTRARLPDDPAALRREIGELHDTHDILVLSGGVSMGKFDYVPRIMEELGVDLVFHKILQRPGLPMWFGVSKDNKPIFALPGNPVSSLVCAVRYVVPAIEQAMGAMPEARLKLPLGRAMDFAPDLTWFLPVRIDAGVDGAPLATPCPTNTSGDFVSLAGTSGFVELPRGQDNYPAGFLADFFSW